MTIRSERNAGPDSPTLAFGGMALSRGPLSSSRLVSAWEVLLRMDKILKVSRIGDKSQKSGAGFVVQHVFVSAVPIP